MNSVPVCLLLLGMVLALGRPAFAQSVEPSILPESGLAEETPAPGVADWLRPQVTQTLRFLFAHRYQAPSLGGLDPDNQIFEIPRHTTEAEARLDVAVEWNRLALTAKPRARWSRDQWADGPRSGDSETDWDLFLLEGGAKARPLDSLVASFGRENLQWGPSQFINPSNPFFAENGRGNPVREIAGMDFARAVWLPTPNWTASWISNTGRGEGDLAGADWHPSHALKLDYLGHDAGASVLAHAGPDASSSLRGYGQWTASDALLLYGELALSRGSRQLYPVADAGPLGGHLEQTQKDDSTILPLVLLGGAYTLEIGPTLSAEYVYNREGYNADEANLFFDIGHRFGSAVQAGLPAPGGVDAPQRLLRRNYLFLQYLQSEIRNRLTVIFRWAQNLDDSSSLMTGFAEYSLSDRWRLFGYGAGGTGGNRDEFGSIVRFSLVGGIECSVF